MSKSGILGDTLDQLGGLAKQTGKSAVQVPGGLAKTAAKQVGIAPSPEATSEQLKAREQSQQQPEANEALRQNQTKEVVASLYAPTPTEKKPEAKTPLAQTVQHIAENHPEKTPEEIQNEAQAAVDLHKTTYYDPLVTPLQQPEEKPAEKVEREKMEDLQEKQKKDQERANKDASVEQAQNVEKHRGASG